MPEIILQYLNFFLIPVTNIITWLVTRRKRNNDMLGQMQQSINMLVEENTKLYGVITQQNEEICKLKVTINKLTAQINGSNRLSITRKSN